ncbi:hypothetical protein LOTGIDRAFT_162087 [Lottia gigantea]|uniref:Anaphase-promoting complex subunit 4 n=1 Tax=Lottia gigantea TaxID=225164 RepID=V4BVL0_LOTGI|nr:hypothetical protein LOTGIDRAFT_162087 [Lottia gigantea]ESO93064.1 hypothetical protein LOTGIDRAFT_162087 [Lottia gigantea]
MPWWRIWLWSTIFISGSSFKKIVCQARLNLLLVGTDNDQLYLFAYGVFPCGVVTFSILDGSKSRHIHTASISQDLKCLSLIIESTVDQSDDIDYYMLSYDTTLLASRHKEIRLMALKYGQIATLLEYLQTTIQQMSEAWEDILMEMDSKLLKFAAEKEKVCKKIFSGFEGFKFTGTTFKREQFKCSKNII